MMAETFEERQLKDNFQYYYGCEIIDDYMFNDPASLPRLGPLARKAISHYAGDKYNPQTSLHLLERDLRLNFAEIIRYKVFHRLEDYDWVFVENFIKCLIELDLKIGLVYDMAIVEEGIKKCPPLHTKSRSPV